MRVLGAIIAGGKSRRFGSDKAAAPVDGVPMIERVHAALAEQVDAVVLCGRHWGGMQAIPDRPGPDLGPLGGLNAALHFAAAGGFEIVLSVPVDTLPLPADLLDRLGPGPAAFAEQYLIGTWPASLADRLEAHVASAPRSVYSWIDASGCALIDDGPLHLRNVNTPADLR